MTHEQQPTTRQSAKVAPAQAPSKLDQLTALLQRPEGADMPTMIAATDWQAHSIRGAMAGALKKKGHATASEKIDGRRVWRTVAPVATPVPAVAV